MVRVAAFKLFYMIIFSEFLVMVVPKC